MSAKKLIFLNQKGGVGKTTTVINLGYCIASMGHKVLLVDFDSQANLTGGVSGDNKKGNSYDLIVGDIPVESTIQQTPFNNLYLIPGSIDLAGLNVELVDKLDRELYLSRRLKEVEDDFDYILVDCPPALGLLTMNALSWAEDVIIPLQCEYYAMEGLNLLMRTITNVKKELNPKINIMGILFTMYSKRARLNAEVVEDISTFFPKLVFETIIPRSIRLAEAPSHGLPINAYDASNAGAKAYMNLAKEVIARGK